MTFTPAFQLAATQPNRNHLIMHTVMGILRRIPVVENHQPAGNAALARGYNQDLPRVRNLLMNGLVVCGSMLVGVLVLEGAARVYRAAGTHPPNNRYALRTQQPAPYRNAPYFSKDFINESFRQPGGWFVPPGTRLVVPGDFHGKYINIENGMRRTTDVPATALHTVFVVGGSTIYGAEVPDDYTIPSALQRLLNARQPGLWRVENRGTISVGIAQQVELLRTLPVKPGDVVIFYDGVNDVVQGVFNGDPKGWVIGENRKVLTGAGPLKDWLVKINLKYAANLAQNYSALLGTVVGEAMNGANLRSPPHLSDPARVESLAMETADLYRQNLEQAEQIATAHGASFLHFLQPQVFASFTRTAYEDQVVHNFYISPNGLETAFEATYPLLKKVPSVDLTHVLDERSGGEEFYLDFCHVNHVANARIAAALAERMLTDVPAHRL